MATAGNFVNFKSHRYLREMPLGLRQDDRRLLRVTIFRRLRRLRRWRRGVDQPETGSWMNVRVGAQHQPTGTARMGAMPTAACLHHAARHHPAERRERPGDLSRRRCRQPSSPSSLVLAQPSSCGPSDCSRSMERRTGNQAPIAGSGPEGDTVSRPPPRQASCLSRQDESYKGDHAQHGGGGEAGRGAWGLPLPSAVRGVAPPKRGRRVAPPKPGASGCPHKRGAWGCPLHRLRRSPSPAARVRISGPCRHSDMA